MNDVVFMNGITTPWVTHTAASMYPSSHALLPTVANVGSLVAQSTYACFAPSFITSSFNLLDRQSALGSIYSMNSLHDNWDGYGGVSILAETALIAASLVSSLPEYVPTPDVTANPNGTISLEWENDRGRAHLEIGKTEYSLYYRPPIGEPLYRDGTVKEIDTSKRKLLSAMYSLASPPDYTINLVSLAKAA